VPIPTLEGVGLVLGLRLAARIELEDTVSGRHHEREPCVERLFQVERPLLRALGGKLRQLGDPVGSPVLRHRPDEIRRKLDRSGHGNDL
jgi:hypothetical protein